MRAVKPQHVVETGTDKGLGSCVLAAALLRNGSGRLTTIDIDPASGYLVGPPYGAVTELVLGDSVETLRGLSTPVDLFIHDSNHSAEYEAAELRALTANLAERAWVLSDNAHVTAELSKWADGTGPRVPLL